MSNKNKPTGGPAFPTNAMTVEYGMNLRDYIAAKAMQGIISTFSDEGARVLITQNAAHQGVTEKQRVAIAAYEYADAMLEARVVI